MRVIKKWGKPAVTLLVMLAASWLFPDGTVDPWHVFNPKKMLGIIFALTLIQYGGSVIFELAGARIGAVLTGFFGGLVSSTATTAALAKMSNVPPQNRNSNTEVLIFLAATIAMHVEGVLILLLGAKDAHFSILLIFLGPAFAACILVFRKSKNPNEYPVELEKNQFAILPTIKLSIFIITILALSKVLQHFLGRSGLLLLTFIVSLFEIHGSFIANLQLHDAGAFDARMLGNLATLSIAASYFSKLFLVFTLGSADLKAQVGMYTGFLFLALFGSWLLFLAVS